MGAALEFETGEGTACLRGIPMGSIETFGPQASSGTRNLVPRITIQGLGGRSL
jgi:hypothetical protein